VTRIGEVRTTLAVTDNRCTLRGIEKIEVFMAATMKIQSSGMLRFVALVRTNAVGCSYIDHLCRILELSTEIIVPGAYVTIQCRCRSTVCERTVSLFPDQLVPCEQSLLMNTDVNGDEQSPEVISTNYYTL
jgi:hypothetical protein